MYFLSSVKNKILHVNIAQIEKTKKVDVVSKGLLREPADSGSGPVSTIN